MIISVGNPGVKNSFYEGVFKHIPPEMIFVFGSNLAGRHGKGAALTARQQYGAEYGVGIGLTGQSYAIPTKDHEIRPLPLAVVSHHIAEFVKFSKQGQHNFYVTPVGTGLAGFSHAMIAPLFRGSINCWFPREWEKYLR